MSDQNKMWRILSGEQQRYDQEYANFNKRNPPVVQRPVWQQRLILGVPAMVLLGVVWLVL